MRRLAAFLRAVNVGGRKVLMDDLRRLSAEAGFDAPATLLASGNLVVGTALAGDEAARRLEAAILAGTGVASDVMVRDAAELDATIAANPFVRQATDEPNRLMAMFLSGAPKAGLSVLADACGLGEAVEAGPGCLYIFYPQGAGVSKLTNTVIERRLGLRGTARNWNTVGKVRAALG